MSLDKAIKHKKEKRSPYRDSRKFDYSCRNHGSCGYCEDTRTFERKRKAFAAQDEIEEYYNERCTCADSLDLDIEKEIFGDEN